MALNFPTNPTPGQTYTGDNGVIYTYDGVKWTGAGVETGFTLPVASTTTAGVVRVDGTTITITDGVISANVQGGGGGTYSNANVASYLTAFNGNILPSANVTYSLGSSTRQWRDLWVSNNTIYIGNVPLTVSNGNLLVNGSLVTGSGSGTDDVLRANVGAYQTFANSNAATQSTAIATLQTQVYANANVATYLPTYTGNIAGNIVKNGYTWAFGTDGNLTVPAGGTITAPIAQEFQLQARDTNSVLRNEINLDPNNGTYMSVWSDGTTSFSSADWDTGSWNNESGLGAARFTDAQALQNFWTTGIGSLGLPIEASINGGARTPNVFYENNNGETYGVFLGLDAVPPGGQGTTVPITSLVFYYQTQSKINMDVDGGEILLDAQSMDLDLRTTNILDLRAGENLNLRGLGAYPVRIYTNDSTHMWEFDTAGSLTLPSEGKINGVGAGAAGDRYGYISWSGNSSGDGSGFNTMRLVPDLQGLEDLDTYIILDPAYVDGPGSIHIRAGGTRDNSLANLYLGGANSHVKIGAGSNPPVTVMANNRSWTFGNTGTTRFPDGTILAPAGQTITMQSDQNSQLLWQNANIAEAPNVPTNTTFSVQPNFATLVVGYRDGNSAEQDNTWLWNIDGMTLPEGGTITEGGGLTGAIRLTPAGGANADQALLIYPTAGGDGDHIHLTAGGGTTELYLGSDNHYVKLVDGGNVEIRTDDLSGNVGTWNFGANANLTLPETGYLRVGSGIVAGFASSPAPVIYGFSSISAENFRFQGNGVNILSTMTDLYANAAVQSANIATLFSNAATQATSISTINNTLTSSNVGIGLNAGATSQGDSAVAVGAGAGTLNQGIYSVAIGLSAGTDNQGARAVAVGSNAGRTNQGDYAVAIGRNAGFTNQGNNSIIINATTGTLNQTTANTFTVAPVRNDVSNVAQVLFYNTTNKEITYGNTINIAGNINAGQFNFANGVNILDTITGVTSISTSVSTLTVNDASGDYTYGALSYDYAVNGVSNSFSIEYSAPLAFGNVDINVGNVTATGTANVANLTTTGNITAGNVSAVNFVGTIQAQVGSSFAYATDAYGSLFNTGGVPLPADINSNAIVAGYTIVGNSGAVTLTVTSATFIPGTPNIVQVATTPTASSLAYPVTVYSANYSPAIPTSTITVGNATVSGNITAGGVGIGGNLNVSGNITQQSAYYETYANVTNSGGNLTCNFVNGTTFYATLTANVTVNFVNVVATAGRVTGATIIVDQGATAYSVANIQINSGGVQTVKWAGGTTNTGTASNTDVMSFSLISLDGTSWRILGQIANYA